LKKCSALPFLAAIAMIYLFPTIVPGTRQHRNTFAIFIANLLFGWTGLGWGIAVMRAWGFTYKSNLVWHKVRKDGGSDGRGVGFYFRNVTELILFGVKGKSARTLAPGRSQTNLLATRKREHSRKPDEQYTIIEACSPGPRIELFARGTRPGWTVWGNQADQNYQPTWLDAA
jgi:N6-adenosine-specific RNA methylase IME4